MSRTVILQIEDDAFLAQIYSKKLESLGFEVLVAGSGEDGLRIVSKETPACILLDILLPGMDGYEVLEKLKSDPSTSEIPVIVVSTMGQREDIEKAKSLGAAGYMIKAHVSPQDIANKVNEILKLD
ncbi:MAG: response regulator [Patescibacteria group bacterium]|nr:response regulator [Patescibacteria group bacterium]